MISIGSRVCSCWNTQIIGTVIGFGILSDIDDNFHPAYIVKMDEPIAAKKTRKPFLILRVMVMRMDHAAEAIEAAAPTA